MAAAAEAGAEADPRSWEWWYLDDDVESQGPFALGELAGWFALGAMTTSTYVWAEEAGAEWHTIEACLGGRLLPQLRAEIDRRRTRPKARAEAREDGGGNAESSDGSVAAACLSLQREATRRSTMRCDSRKRSLPPLPPPVKRTQSKNKNAKTKTVQTKGNTIRVTIKKRKKNKNKNRDQKKNTNEATDKESDASTIELATLQRPDASATPPDNGEVTNLASEVINPLTSLPHTPQQLRRPSISDWLDEHETTPTLTRLTRKIRAVVLFVLCACVSGSVFLLAQELARYVSGAAATADSGSLWWWQRVSSPELLFYIALLSALAYFSIRVATRRHHRNDRGASWAMPTTPLSLALCVFAWVFVLGLMWAAPSVWLKSNPSFIEKVPAKTNGCVSTCDLLKKIPYLAVSCPDIAANPGAFYFTRFQSPEGYIMNLLKLRHQVPMFLSMSNAERAELISFGEFDGFGDVIDVDIIDCVLKSLGDLVCAYVYQPCRPEDCAHLSESCEHKENYERITANFFDACSSNRSQTKDLSRKEMKSQVDVYCAASLVAFKFIQCLGLVDEGEMSAMTAYIDIMREVYDQVPAAHQSCPEQQPAKSTFSCGESANNASSSNEDIVSLNESNCRPLKQGQSRWYFHESTSPISIETHPDASTLLGGVCLFFAALVFVFADTAPTRANVNGSALHIGCLFACIFMSFLVFIGSSHLQNAASLDETAYSTVFSAWEIVYLVVSFVCFQGGLVLIVRPATANFRPHSGTTTTATATSPSDDHSMSWLLNSCCPSRRRKSLVIFLQSVQGLKAVFWDPTGDYFWLKLVVIEVFEWVVQLNSLVNGAVDSDANAVLVSSIILACNIVTLSIVVLWSPKCFPEDSDVFARTAFIIMVEILFDKLLVMIVVLLRFQTIISTLSTVDQLARHLGLLVPALMTFLDIQDVLALEARIKANKGSTNYTHQHSQHSQPQRQRLSIVVKVSEAVDSFMQRSCTLCLWKAMLVLSMLFGVGLGTYAATSFAMQRSDCVAKIGPVAVCSFPRVYYRDGFFSPTTCAFDRVETMDCSGGIFSTGVLPDAEDEYAKMTKLRLVNVSGSNLRLGLRGWGRAPNRELIIDVSGSAQFSGLQYAVCAAATSKYGEIRLDGTPSSKHLNWSGQIKVLAAAANGSAFLFNPACLKALKNTLETLSLARNGLTEDDFDGRLNFGKAFPKLRSIDLRQNRIENITISRRAGISGFAQAFSDLLVRQGYYNVFSKLSAGDIPDENKTLGAPGKQIVDTNDVILLHGNRVSTVTLQWLPFDVADAWFKQLGPATATTLRWLILDTVDLTSIFPGAFRAMPSLEKLTIVRLLGGTLKTNLVGPYHLWGLSAGAKVCTLREIRLLPGFPLRCDLTIVNVETCCSATCQNCCPNASSSYGSSWAIGSDGECENCPGSDNCQTCAVPGLGDFF